MTALSMLTVYQHKKWLAFCADQLANRGTLMWTLANSAYLNNQLQAMDWAVFFDILSSM